MLFFLCKNSIQISTKYQTHVLVLQNASLQFIAHFTKSTNKPSFTLDYLINTCGLSPEKAVYAARNLRLRTKQNSDSVLMFLKNHGLTKTQIAKIISFYPPILYSNVSKTLEPKIKLFQDMGLSDSELGRLIVLNPNVLVRSLKSEIIPTICFLKSFVQEDGNIIKALKRSRWLLSCDLKKHMQPNISLLQDCGVPNSRISYIVMTHPRILMQKTSKLKQVVETVDELGFKRSTGMFTLAINVISSMSKSKWDSKFELLKVLGWSETEILDAFRRMPICLTCSEEKMRSGMDFFVNKLKLKTSIIASHPLLLNYSLKERVIPRSIVWKILMSKELVQGERILSSMMILTEKNFLEKYVMKYQEKVPDLLKAYKGEIEFSWL